MQAADGPNSSQLWWRQDGVKNTVRLEVEEVNPSDATGVSAARIFSLAVATIDVAALSGCHTHDMVLEVRYKETQAPVADAEIVIEYMRMLSLKPEVAPLHFKTDAAGRLAMRFDFREPVIDVRCQPRVCRFSGIAFGEDDLREGQLTIWQGGFGLGDKDVEACDLEWRAWIGGPTSSPPPVREKNPMPLWLPPT